MVLFFVRKNQTNGHSQRLLKKKFCCCCCCLFLTFRRRKDKARDDIKIFFFFSLLLLIEMMIAAVLSLLLLLLLSLSLSVCENNNTECVSFVFCCCLTSFTVCGNLLVFCFSSSLFGSLLKSKERRLQCFFFFPFFCVSLGPQEEEEERVIRDYFS